jgi:hypothetical protein
MKAPPLGTRLDVAARPRRGVDRKDNWPGARPVGDEQLAKPILIDATSLERLVEAAVAAGIPWLQRKCRNWETGPEAQSSVW